MVLASYNCLALGISPAQKFIDFEPNLKTTFSFAIVNNEERELNIVLKPRGEFAEYITLPEEMIHIAPDEARKDVRFDLDLPEKIEKPGSHTIEIVVSERLPGSDPGGNTVVGVSAAVVFKAIVRVPYPGKYAEAKMQVYPGDVNGTTRFVVLMFNLGKEKIESAKAKIKLYANDKVIDEIESDEISLKPKEDGKLEADWNEKVDMGQYDAKAVVEYDDKSINLDSTFEIGNVFVDILKIEVLDFHLGDVARFDLYLANKWNQPLENVYAELMIYRENVEYTQFKTASAEMAPLATERLRAYWDTQGVDIGDYDLKIMLHYSDKVTERIIKAYVGLDDIRTDLSPTGRVILGESGLANRNTILVILVIVLLAANIGWFMYFKRSRVKNEMPKKNARRRAKK